VRRLSADPDPAVKGIAASWIEKATGQGLSLMVRGRPLGGASGEILPRAELERVAIAELVGAQPLWGLDAERPAFAELFYELKEAVRTGQSPEAMAERVLASPLVEQVRRASVPPRRRTGSPSVPTASRRPLGSRGRGTRSGGCSRP
jgi:hypothetical protein